jgi:putative SOS response-associated peptidase YedK
MHAERAMCYSAQIEAELRKLKRQEGATLDYEQAERLFHARLSDPRIRIPRAFEANFDNPVTAQECRIRELIERYRGSLETRLQQDLFGQSKRLADAQRSLQKRETRKAREDVRIATAKIDANRARLVRLRAPDIDVEDARIFPFWYAPIVIDRDGEKVMRLARYHLRPRNAAASIDRQFPGLYNARRDNLEKFWRNEFGHSHAVMYVASFFENVTRDDANVVLHFNPRPAQIMRVACLYSERIDADAGELLTFAAVTDEPPPEIAAAGHDRCIVNLLPENAERWLTPAGRSVRELQAILDEKQRPYYEHAIAA